MRELINAEKINAELMRIWAFFAKLNSAKLEIFDHSH